MRKLDVKQLAVRFVGGSDTPYDATYINFDDEIVKFVIDGKYSGHEVTANFDEVEFFEKPKPVRVHFKVRGKFTRVEEEWDLKEFRSKAEFVKTCKDAIERVLHEELENAPIDKMGVNQVKSIHSIDTLVWINILNESEIGESLWVYANNLLVEKIKLILEEKTKDPEVYSIRVISHNSGVEFETEFRRGEMKGIRKKARAMIRNDVKAKKRYMDSFGSDKGEIEMACSEPSVQKLIHEYYDNYHHHVFVKDATL